MSNLTKNHVLKIENFSIRYEPPHTYSHSLRDKFVEVVKNPVDFFFQSKDQLSVIENISFNVGQGDIIGLIGANGVGKTSLCRYLSKIIKSEKIQGNGDIRAIFDTNINLYPNLSGYDNTVILTELLYSKYSKSEKKKIIQESLEFSDLKDFLQMPINRYSKGMKARLYLSLVTARPADLIVLDEIFGATDIFFGEKLSQRIKSLIDESGAAVIVSHNFEDIRSYCNRILVLANKKIAFDGPVEDGIRFYENLSLRTQ